MALKVSRQTAEVFARMLPPEERAQYLAQHKAPDSVRVAAGRAADAIGRAWEKWLREQHAAAREAGIAVVRKVGPPIERTGPGGETIKVVGFGPADFQGVIRAGDGSHWKPLAIEAKSYEGRLQRHEIAEHQRADLEMIDRVGGVALVAIELHDEAGVSLGTWALPWPELETRWRVTVRSKPGGAGRVESRSVGPEELRGWEAQGLYLGRFAR